MAIMPTSDTPTWTPPGWTITEKHSRLDDTYRSVQLRCNAPDCGHIVFTGLRADLSPDSITTIPSMRDHQEQHRPGRAPNLEVDWVVSACCTVCEDGIGDILQEDDGLTCRECGTVWAIDGTGGEREEAGP